MKLYYGDKPMTDHNQEFRQALKKKLEKIESRISDLENQIQPSIKAVETENGKKLVISDSGKDKWINQEYLNKVLENIDLELSDIETDQKDQDGENETIF